MSDFFYFDRTLLSPWLGGEGVSNPNTFCLMDSEQSTMSSNKRPCLLCLAQKSTFYCQECVCQGEFCHSNPRRPEVMAEKKMRLEVIQGQMAKVSEQITLARKRTDEVNRIRDNMYLCKQRVKYLSYLISSKRDQLNQRKQQMNRLTEENMTRKKRLPQFESKVEEIKRVKMKLLEVRSKEKMREEGNKLRMAMMRKSKAKELTDNIFSIEQVFPERSTKESLEEDLIHESLSEAIHMSFINGRWVTTTNDMSGEMFYQIVAPLLPSSGDYGAYQAWIQTREKSDKLDESLETGECNPAHTIASGLMFAAQLTQELALLFDIILPFRRLKFQDFGKIVNSEYKLNRKVTRLNLNILHLCLSQGVSPEKLRAKQTLHNLKQLIDLIHNQDDSFSSSFTVGISNQPLLDSEFLHQMSVTLSNELSKFAWINEELTDEDDDETVESSKGSQMIPDEEDWDALQEQDDLMVAMPRYLHDRSLGPMSGSPSSLSTTATSFMSSLWRGLTN